MEESRKRFDYLVDVPGAAGVNTEAQAQLQDYLSKKGDQGWEFVMFWGKTVIFKKEL